MVRAATVHLESPSRSSRMRLVKEITTMANRQCLLRSRVRVRAAAAVLVFCCSVMVLTASFAQDNPGSRQTAPRKAVRSYSPRSPRSFGAATVGEVIGSKSSSGRELDRINRASLAQFKAKPTRPVQVRGRAPFTEANKHGQAINFPHQELKKTGNKVQPQRWQTKR